ncbi:MAG: elongation factor P [Syntrophaceae bacterium]|nr:elongation factor P [Syntrophaceae bacterium]
MYSASDLRKNLRIMLDDEPYIVVDFQFVKPGKGQSLYRCKLRNMLTGSQVDRTFREVDTFQPAETEEKNMQFLYREGDAFHFMDNESYEQIALTAEQVGDAKNFLIENMECKVLLFRDRPIDITLPNFVDVVVTEAPPWIKGDTVSGNYKPVIVETGYKVSVPPFIEQGEKIRIDTRTGEYLTRVKE